MLTRLARRWLPLVVHLGALTPLALLLWDASRQDLTANPIQAIEQRTGLPALTLLVLSLACTPASSLLGFKPALLARRSLGLYSFFYVCLHLATFVGLDYGFDFRLLYAELVEKRYVLAGFAAFLLLIPLAITSTKGWQRRLGHAWTRLHRLVYLAVLLAVGHFLWSVKSDVRLPLLFGAIVAILLTLRVPEVRRAVARLRGGPRARSPRAPTASQRGRSPAGD
jgi:sulfoxide reductase heme-binding subunit YedZ